MAEQQGGGGLLWCTDSEQAYRASGAPHRLWMQSGVVRAASFLSEAECEQLNTRLIHVIMDAWAAVVDDIHRWAAALATADLQPNRWIATRDPIGQAHSLVQLAYLDAGLDRHLWRLSLPVVLAALQKAGHRFTGIELVLRPIARLAPSAVAEATGLPVRAQLINERPALLRRLGRWARAGRAGLRTLTQRPRIHPPPEGRIRLLWFVGPARNLFELFEPFFQRPEVKARYHVLVVTYTSAELTPAILHTAERCLAGVSHQRVAVEDFDPGWIGGRTGLDSHDALYRHLRNQDPATAPLASLDLLDDWERMYASLDAVFTQFRPQLALHNNIYDPSRVLSDVARLHAVPSVNVQYSLFPDIPSNRYNIRFDLRLHINAWTQALFERIGDPTPRHDVIGYLKFDALSEVHTRTAASRAQWLAAEGFDPAAPVVFFGSTYGLSYDVEKVTFAQRLAHICKRRGWNLLVKKHPNERDQLVADALQQVGYRYARVYPHEALPLAEAIAMSDVVTNQASGLALEALYLRRPLVYLCLDPSQPGNTKTLDESVFPLLASEAEIEAYLEHALSAEGRAEIEAQLEALVPKYLFRADGKAGERLHRHLEALLAESNA